MWEGFKTIWLKRESKLLSFWLHNLGKAIAIHILPNTCRSKDNDIMKFNQLMQYNIWNIFLKKLYTKYSGRTPDPFLKNQ